MKAINTLYIVHREKYMKERTEEPHNKKSKAKQSNGRIVSFNYGYTKKKDLSV
jgi:hypothetical protein